MEKEGNKLLDPFTRRSFVATRLVSLALHLTSKLRNA
jgi:hypothetical protein